MTHICRALLACLAPAWLLACLSPQGAEPAATDHGPAAMVAERAIGDAVARFGVARDSLSVQRIEAVTWADGSLGCPEPGAFYTQALVRGWRIWLQAGDELLDYHAAASGHVILCPPGRAVEPPKSQSDPY